MKIADMRIKLIKFVISCFFVTLFCFPIVAEGASVTYLKGKVEVSRGGEWIPLKVGDLIQQDETINTGFQSEARLRFNGSVMAIPALSRVTLETLSTSDSKDSVSLYVDTGAVRSKVTHTDNRKIDYTARTAVAVASVRGTDFTINARGKVQCIEGAVSVYSAKKYNKKSGNSSDEAEEEEAEEEGEETDGTEGGAEGSDETNEVAEAVNTETEAAAESEAETPAVAETPAANNDEPAVAETTKQEEAPKQTETAKADEPKTEQQVANKDQTPATATTAASDIAASSPTGSVVVGAGQTTSFTATGNPEKPASDVSIKTTKIKSQVETQAEKETVSSGSSVNTAAEVVEIIKPTTGAIRVTISFVEE